MNKIKRIYDLLYSPIITPYNLLENAKLDNYEYVNFYKSETGLVSEMKCRIDRKTTAIFYYYFDNEDNLQNIFMEINSKKELIYDRKIELQKEKEDFLKNKQSIFKIKAI